MKIAYVISTGMCVSPHSGIRVQAVTWAEELERQGHEVVRVNPWEQQDWQKYDVIHLFGYSSMLNHLKHLNHDNIFFSPIIDSFQPVWKYKLATFWGSSRLRLTSHNYEYRMARPYIQKWCVRSQFEKEYVIRGYGVPEFKIVTIPLSYRLEAPKEYPQKELYCLHVSKISDGRKNVERLIDAAISFGFRLVLAGSVDVASFEHSTLKRKIETNDNISYLGRVSDVRLAELYAKAKVFALPSIGEGVGLVALEAAANGCDIVVTNIGGPKEYYGDMAFVVNPYDVKAIGHAVMEAMEATDQQPRLMHHVRENYNLSHCMRLLVESYLK